MTPDRWQRIQELFHEAEPLPGAERSAFLVRACDGDDQLRREVESLLNASAGDHLEKAVSDAVAGLREDRPAPAAPESIAGYRILRRLGEGGMGIVYEAEQHHPRRTVALKILRSARHAAEHARRLFEREAQALGRLKHPGIATIFESGVAEDGLPFLVMELVSGQPLDEWLKQRGPLRTLRQQETEAVLRVFRAICDAVTYAHQNGVIHRDLKPSNIIVSDPAAAADPAASTTAPPLVKILDFGLARIVDRREDESLYQTETAMVQGSLPYMSPEQARGEHLAIDLRTDIYSLGVILYWMLTREHPYFEGSHSVVDCLRLIETEPPRRFSHWTSKFDPDLEAIVLKALEKEPARRYASVAGLAGDLDRYLSNLPILARPPSTLYQLRMMIRRNRAAFAGVVAAAALLVIFSITTAIQARRISLERDRANQEAATARKVSDFLVDLFRETNPVEAGGEVTARDLLRTGRERVSKELGDQPELRARLLDRIGDAYSVIGPLSESQSAYEESLRVRAAAVGDSSIESAYTWNGLATAFHNQGNFDLAAQAARRAAEITERHRGPGDQQVAEMIAGLALSLSASGDTPGALIAIRRAVDLDQQHGRAGSLPAAYRLQSLGAILRQKGDYRAALEPLRESAAIQRQLAEPLSLSGVLNELGMALNLAGYSAESEKTLRECLEAARKVFGDAHGNIAMIKVNIAYALVAQGRGGDAERLILEASEVFDQAFGAAHPRKTDILLALGDAQASQGRVGEARAALTRARAIAHGAWGPTHPRSARATARLGRLEAEQGDARTAIPLLEEAIAALDQAKGTPELDIFERALGQAYAALGDKGRAEPLLLRAHASLLQHLGAAHRETRLAAEALNRLRATR